MGTFDLPVPLAHGEAGIKTGLAYAHNG